MKQSLEVLEKLQAQSIFLLNSFYLVPKWGSLSYFSYLPASDCIKNSWGDISLLDYLYFFSKKNLIMFSLKIKTMIWMIVLWSNFCLFSQLAEKFIFVDLSFNKILDMYQLRMTNFALKKPLQVVQPHLMCPKFMSYDSYRNCHFVRSRDLPLSLMCCRQLFPETANPLLLSPRFLPQNDCFLTRSRQFLIMSIWAPLLHFAGTLWSGTIVLYCWVLRMTFLILAFFQKHTIPVPKHPRLSSLSSGNDGDWKFSLPSDDFV